MHIGRQSESFSCFIHKQRYGFFCIRTINAKKAKNVTNIYLLIYSCL